MSRRDTLRLPAPSNCAGPAAGAAGAFEAQVIGQPGVRRGLREGEPALNRARAAYLLAEWSGPQNRRLEPGLLRRTAL